MLTRGVAALAAGQDAAILHSVRRLEDFSEADNPHGEQVSGEQDFSFFEADGRRVVFNWLGAC